ncbi:Transcriptional regulator, GntR family [Microbacterium esteraromaticum]|uniref:Transcriptional regulator, GntR family n=1 Tax=Microbacterium esteraromaticum TaxID=57043 RepID=A0A1R4JGH1_9MICO|nr:GntR family transcriptional regulator [Microbacterium esteraromaticum]SJN31024.1 Transcriptional regulator, GntR family [Microbacterium esteraromaticum]
MSGADERELGSSRVAAWLRDAILDGVRTPDSKLIERDLAAEFGVSRIPVRDALKMLDGEGLVELRPRTWAVVREFTATDLADLDEVRLVLEPMAFRLAAERRRSDGLARLQAAVVLEQEGARLGDKMLSRQAAVDFHEIVVEVAGNRLLAELMGSIRSRMRWSLVQHDDLQHITAEHAALYQAVHDQDGDRASALAIEHVESSRRVRRAYRERAGGDRRTADADRSPTGILGG